MNQSIFSLLRKIKCELNQPNGKDVWNKLGVVEHSGQPSTQEGGAISVRVAWGTQGGRPCLKKAMKEEEEDM